MRLDLTYNDYLYDVVNDGAIMLYACMAPSPRLTACRRRRREFLVRVYVLAYHDDTLEHA